MQLEHETESVVVKIPHLGGIWFVVVHATINEGYSYWWNNETLRQMLKLDNNYPDNIFIQLAYSILMIKEVNATNNLKQWRKKHTKLA